MPCIDAGTLSAQFELSIPMRNVSKILESQDQQYYFETFPTLVRARLPRLLVSKARQPVGLCGRRPGGQGFLLALCAVSAPIVLRHRVVRDLSRRAREAPERHDTRVRIPNRIYFFCL